MFESAPSRGERLTVVIVAIDGVRWQDIFEGVDPALAKQFGLDSKEIVSADALTPHLHELARSSGVLLGGPRSRGHVRASGPNFLSLPGYEEMLGGRAPRCRDNQCQGIERPTIVDEFASERDARLGDVVVITSWPRIGCVAATDPDRAVFSLGRSGGTHLEVLRTRSATAHWLALGERAPSAPGHDDFRPDAYTAALATAVLATRPRFLFLGLGETDEYAHGGDYRKYLGALRAADRTVGTVVSTLRGFEAAGVRTLLLVTADHGRERLFKNHGREFPESARVWLAAAGNALTIAPHDGDSLDRDLYLSDLVPTVRYAARMPEPDAPGGHVISELFEPGREPSRFAGGGFH